VVEPENCCCVHRALAAGRPVDSPVDSVAASALGATRVGEVPFGVLRSAGSPGRLPAGLRSSVPDAPGGARPPSASGVVSVLVTDAELLDAQARLWEEFRLAVEPAAAVPFAAWLAGRVPGERPCLVLCGANT
jgi:threonine dehydratase